MPVAAGRIVNVFGEVTVNWVVDNWQKHNNLPAPAPVYSVPMMLDTARAANKSMHSAGSSETMPP